MAIKKNTTSQPSKLSAAEAKELVVKLTEELKILKEDSASCNLCGITKKRDKFYISSDARCKSGITGVCKECARKIALRVDKNGEEHQPTKESCQLALRYLNKPFLNTVWNASIQESDNLTAGKVKHNVWTSYIKNIQMVNYNGLT